MLTGVRRLAWATLLLATSVPALAGEPIDSPVKVPVDGVATEAQVRRAVRVALTKRGWTPLHEKAGYVEGELTKPDDYAVRIAVAYDTKNVTIRYLRSTGLDYDREERTIHRAYNKWMRMLSREIAVNLALFVDALPGERENPHDPMLLPQVVPPVEPAQDAAAPPQAASPPPPAAPAPVPAATGPTLRAGAELRAQAKLSASVMSVNKVAVTVAPRGPLHNGEGTWWYVKTPGGSGWVRQSDLR